MEVTYITCIFLEGTDSRLATYIEFTNFRDKATIEADSTACILYRLSI